MVARATSRATSMVTSKVTTSGGGASGGGGGGSPFDPASISGLWVWHDLGVNGDALNSISPDVQATDGQTLRRVLDRSGNAYHADQSTGLNQPLFESTEYARAAARFDGTNDAMIYSGNGLQLTNSAEGITVFLAMRFRNNPTSSKSIFSATASNGGFNLFLLRAGATSGKYSLGGRRLQSDTFQEITSSGSVSTTGMQVITACLHYSTASALLRVNGVEEVVSNFQAIGTTSAENSAAIAFGSFFNGGSYSSSADIDVAEMLVYKSAVEIADIAAVESYLASKHQ